MKINKKILCGALAGVALFTGVGVLGGCNIIKEKEPGVDYQSKMETVITNWERELDSMKILAPWGELVDVNTREEGNTDTRALNLFIENGIELNKTTEFLTIGGNPSIPNSYDNNTLVYIDELDNSLYLEDTFGLQINDFKINQYYKVKDEGMYFIFTVDNEKVRLTEYDNYISQDTQNLSYNIIRITDYYYNNNNECITIESMAYNYSFGTEEYMFGNLKEIDSKGWSYSKIVSSTNKDLRLVDGYESVYYSNHGECNQGGEMDYRTNENVRIFSEIDGIYYINDEFTTQTTNKINSIKQILEQNILSVEQLEQTDYIEIEDIEEE